jgi:hypothetical protein
MKKKGSMKAQARVPKNTAMKDVEHAFLRVDRANLDDLLAVFLRGFDDLIEPDVRADELDRPVSAGRYGLRAGPGEPEDRRAAG